MGKALLIGALNKFLNFTPQILSEVCGANNIETIVNYIESTTDWFKQYLPIKKAPSYHTIWWILILMDPQELYQAFSSFLKEASSILQNPHKKSLYSIYHRPTWKEEKAKIRHIQL